MESFLIMMQMILIKNSVKRIYGEYYIQVQCHHLKSKYEFSIIFTFFLSIKLLIK